MKKLLAFILTAMLAVTAFTTVISAAPSPEKNVGVITTVTAKDEDGNEVKVEITDPLSDDKSAFNAAVAELQKTNKNLRITDHKHIRLSEGKELKGAITVDFKVPGITKASKGYVLVKKADGSIAKFEGKMSDGTITVTLDVLGDFVLVTDLASKSPQTSDNTAFPLMTLLIASAFTALVSAKKIINV